ncbi:MAG TPA: hypothetical protein DEO65_13690 [Bacillus bacterium]|nr:hypothetical protein [Bacillus sp. (in: firmicutes)]
MCAYKKMKTNFLAVPLEKGSLYPFGCLKLIGNVEYGKSQKLLPNVELLKQLSENDRKIVF